MGVAVHGDVEDGFGHVADAFRANFEERNEVGAACAVVVDGRPVVDLWGGHRDRARTRPWERDTMVTVFSTTKGFCATAMAVAHSRGLFELDRPVAMYWPEFAQGGKEDVTVRQLLSHEAGLAVIETPVTLSMLADPDAYAMNRAGFAVPTDPRELAVRGALDRSMEKRSSRPGPCTGLTRRPSHELCRPEGVLMHAALVVVHGEPGAGKSTLARSLGTELTLPVFDRDDSKDQMFDNLGWSDRDWSARVGAASWDMLLMTIERLIANRVSTIAESNFRPTDPALPNIAELRRRSEVRPVETYCTAPPETNGSSSRAIRGGWGHGYRNRNR